MITTQKHLPMSIYAYSIKYLGRGVSKSTLRKQALEASIKKVALKRQKPAVISELDRIAYFR